MHVCICRYMCTRAHVLACAPAMAWGSYLPRVTDGWKPQQKSLGTGCISQDQRLDQRLKSLKEAFAHSERV